MDSLHDVVHRVKEDGVPDLLPLGEGDSREEQILVLSNDRQHRLLQRILPTGGRRRGRKRLVLLHERLDHL